LKKILILFISFTFSTLSSGIVDMTQSDKKKHFLGTSIVSFIVNKHLFINKKHTKQKRLIQTILISNIPGLFKEIMDSKEVNNKFDPEDLQANFLGSLAGYLISEKTNFPFMINYTKTSNGKTVSINSNFSF